MRPQATVFVETMLLLDGRDLAYLQPIFLR